MSTELAHREVIAVAKTNGDSELLRELRAQADAAALYAKRKGWQEEANMAGAAKVRCEAALGAIDLEANPHGGRRDGEQADNGVNLADIREGTRAAWRRLGALWDTPELDELIERAWADDDAGVTTAYLDKLLRGGMDVHYSSNKGEWETPQDLFDELDAEFGFELDVCALESSAKCNSYFTPEDDGLDANWLATTCWMNPPYGDVIAKWVRKAWEESQDGATVVCLVPARVDTGWWWDYCRHGEVRFLRGRLKFGGAETGAPFPSAVVVFGPDRKAVVRWWER